MAVQGCEIHTVVAARGAFAQVTVTDESRFQQPGTQSSSHLYAWSHVSMFVLQSDSGKSTSILSQHQVQDGPLWMILRSFPTGIRVSSPLQTRMGLKGRGWIVWGRSHPASLSHMGHMCLHLCSKPMCPSLPHPCSYHIPLSF